MNSLQTWKGLLFSPFSIKGVDLKNRIVMSPMCMNASKAKDGKVTDWHLVHYASRAVGQAGLVMVEATSVLPEGRTTEEDLGIWDDQHVEGLSRLAQFIRENGAKSGIQLNHAGRKAGTGGDLIGPSAIAARGAEVPKEASAEDIAHIVRAFGEAARRAAQAGFDIIELHGAHGFLLNQFLSPRMNFRNDAYGGDEAGRYRLISEVIEAVRREWRGPLLIRLSTNEYLHGGIGIDVYSRYAGLMRSQGIDLIDCSSNGEVFTPIGIPGDQRSASRYIRDEAHIPTAAVGSIVSGRQAEEILALGHADLVFIGKEMLRNPYWPRTAAMELGVRIGFPDSYGQYGADWFDGNPK